MQESFEITKGEWEDKKGGGVFVYLDESIGIEVICVCMRYVDSVEGLHLLRIKSYFHSPFHHISDSEVREPRIDEDTDIFSLSIRYIDEEFGMSERGDDHAERILNIVIFQNIITYFSFLFFSLYSSHA